MFYFTRRLTAQNYGINSISPHGKRGPWRSNAALLSVMGLLVVGYYLGKERLYQRGLEQENLMAEDSKERRAVTRQMSEKEESKR